MACPATENKNVWPFVAVRFQCKIIPNEEMSFLGSGVEQGTLNIIKWRCTIQISFFFKNRHVATWGGGGYLTLICSLLSHPQTFLVKYTRNYNFLVGPNKQLLSSDQTHAFNEPIRFSFFFLHLLSCVYQLGHLRKRNTGKDSIKTLQVLTRILMKDKHVWKEIYYYWSWSSF